MKMRIYVRGILVNDERKILFLKKGPSQSIAPGKWVLPGGAVEFGEDATTALKRELIEEIGFTATAVTLVGENTRVIDSTHWQGLIFLVHAGSGPIENREPNKHDDLAWRDVDFAKSVMSPNEYQALELALGAATL